jgi:hypothetical protein
MASEIVDRLRDLAGPSGVGVFAVALRAAADRIEALEIQINNMEHELGLWREAFSDTVREAVKKEE